MSVFLASLDTFLPHDAITIKHIESSLHQSGVGSERMLATMQEWCMEDVE